MLVDSSIVVLENVFRHRGTEANPRLAAAHGAGEIAGALIASTATSVVIFLPIIFLGSFAGQLLKEFGLSISYALLASLIVSLSVLPMLASKFLKRNAASSAEKADAKFAKFRAGYANLLKQALDKKPLIFTIVVVLLGTALLIYPRMDQEFLPTFDEGFWGEHQFPVRLAFGNRTGIGDSHRERFDGDSEIASVAVQSGDQGKWICSLCSRVPDWITPCFLLP